mgnify:CR=1 FL=1
MSNDKVKELIYCLSIGTVFKLNGYLIAKCISKNCKDFIYRDCIEHKNINIDELLDGDNYLTIIGGNKTEFLVL